MKGFYVFIQVLSTNTSSFTLIRPILIALKQANIKIMQRSKGKRVTSIYRNNSKNKSDSTLEEQ